MTAGYFENHDHYQLRQYLSGKQFFVSVLIVCLMLAVNVVVNIIDLLHEFNSDFLLFQPFILAVIEALRNAIIISLIVGLLRLLLKSRKAGILDSPSIAMIVRIMAFGAVTIFFLFFILYYQLYLFHPLFSIIYMVAVLGGLILFIFYINRINTLPFDEDRAIPNPTIPIIWLAGAFAFLIFHFIYLGNGGTYSLHAAKGFPVINISFAKYVALLLLDVAIVYLLIGLNGAAKEKGKGFRLVPFAAAGVVAVAILISIVSTPSQPRYTIEQFENTNKFVQYLFPTISNRDSVIFAVGTTDSGESWPEAQTIYYDFGVGNQVNLYYDMNSIPSISSTSQIVLTIPDTAEVYDIIVYNTSQETVDIVDSWEDLALLPEGTYIVKLLIHNTIFRTTIDRSYLFILNVK